MVEYFQGFRLFYLNFSFFFLAALRVGFRFGGRWGGGVVYFHWGFCSFLTLLVCGVQIRLCSIRLLGRGLWFLDSPGVHQFSSSLQSGLFDDETLPTIN